MIEEIKQWLKDGAPEPYLAWYCANYSDDITTMSANQEEALLRDPEHELGSVFPELKNQDKSSRGEYFYSIRPPYHRLNRANG